VKKWVIIPVCPISPPLPKISPTKFPPSFPHPPNSKALLPPTGTRWGVGWAPVPVEAITTMFPSTRIPTRTGTTPTQTGFPPGIADLPHPSPTRPPPWTTSLPLSRVSNTVSLPGISRPIPPGLPKTRRPRPTMSLPHPPPPPAGSTIISKNTMPPSHTGSGNTRSPNIVSIGWRKPSGRTKSRSYWPCCILCFRCMWCLGSYFCI